MDISYKPKLPLKPRPICIIGAGGIVNDAHLPAYRSAGFEVHSLCDLDLPKAGILAAKFGISKVFASIEEQVADAPADVVYDVATMADQIPAILEKLPDCSFVLVQKPVGDSLPEALEIREIARRKRQVVAVNCQLRYAPFTMAARWLVESGLIGDIYDMEVKLSVATPWEIFPRVNVHPRLEILYHSIHYIDLIRSFLGNPASIFARTLGHPEKTQSSTRSTIVFNYDAALRAVIQTNHDHDFGSRHQESHIKWEGTRGAIIAKMGLLLDYPVGRPDAFEYCLLKPGEVPAWQLKELEGSWFPDAFIGTMASLMRYAEGSESTLPTRLDDVVDTMAVVEAAYQSSACGGHVPQYKNFQTISIQESEVTV